MTLFKRREYAIKVGGTHTSWFQAPSLEAAQLRAADIAEQRGLPGGAWSLHREPNVTYTFQCVHQGQKRTVDTGQRDLRRATEFARRYREELKSGRLETLRVIQLRRSPTDLTVGRLLKEFARYAAVAGLAPGTARNYPLCLRRILAVALPSGTDPDQVSLLDLTARLVFEWRAKVAATVPAGDDAQRRKVEGSANSMLNQARGLFSARAMEHYRLVAKIDLPPNIREFLDAPGFTDVVKEEYHLPPDSVVARTFADLAGKRESDPDVFVATWLALGFGLRKSEAAAVRAGWFRVTPQGVFLDLRATLVPGSFAEKASTKNGSVCPSIQCSNGAWQHLQPIVASLQAEDYLLRAPTATGRCEEVFRRLSAWMADLGWATDKKLHELRAYAGCQVARRDGIEAASRWLRHSSIVVTQRHYGRYLRPTITDAPLQIPSLQPWVPTVVDVAR